MAFCLHCGADNPEDARYCHNCGVELGFAQTPTPRPETVIEGVPTPDDVAQRAGGQPAPGDVGDPPEPKDPEPI